MDGWMVGRERRGKSRHHLCVHPQWREGWREGATTHTHTHAHTHMEMRECHVRIMYRHAPIRQNGKAVRKTDRGHTLSSENRPRGMQPECTGWMAALVKAKGGKTAKADRVEQQKVT
uniref:Uncharacterized protein n=1 Tax=Vitrella brassicaformis TaxID=1169539 RepID=A0A7S1JVS1_9ALVE